MVHDEQFLLLSRFVFFGFPPAVGLAKSLRLLCRTSEAHNKVPFANHPPLLPALLGNLVLIYF